MSCAFILPVPSPALPERCPAAGWAAVRRRIWGSHAAVPESVRSPPGGVGTGAVRCCCADRRGLRQAVVRAAGASWRPGGKEEGKKHGRECVWGGRCFTLLSASVRRAGRSTRVAKSLTLRSRRDRWAGGAARPSPGLRLPAAPPVGRGARGRGARLLPTLLAGETPPAPVPLLELVIVCLWFLPHRQIACSGNAGFSCRVVPSSPPPPALIYFSCQAAEARGSVLMNG